MQQLRLLFAISLYAALSGCGSEITMPITGTIYGQLQFADGTAAAGIEVLVEGTELSDVSDAQGEFVINGVLAVDEDGMGKYYQVRGSGTRNQISVGFIVTRFKVKGQQSYGLGEVTVLPTGVVSGTLLLEGESDHSGAVVGMVGTSLQAITRADGSYRIAGVPAHEGYHISCTRSGFHDMTIEAIIGTAGEEPIRVLPGMVTDLGSASMQREGPG